MKKLARFCRFAAGGALAVLLMLIVTLVLARYASISLPWADEVARITFVWMVALGAAAGLEKNAHFALKVFTNWVSPRSRSLLERVLAAASASILIVFLFALHASIPILRLSVMPATGWSRAWLQAPLVMLATLGIGFMVVKAMRPSPDPER